MEGGAGRVRPFIYELHTLVSKNIFTRARILATVLTAVIGLIIFTVPASAITESDPLYFSCSAQMHAAFGPVFFETFTEQTGIEVDVKSLSREQIKGIFSGRYSNWKELGGVVRAAKVYPYVISFITRAAVYNEGDLKVLDVDGISPDSPDYNYFQSFSFVTKGKPQG